MSGKIFKVFIAGEPKTRKSSLIKRVATGRFCDKYVKGNVPPSPVTFNTTFGKVTLILQETSMDGLDSLLRNEYKVCGIIFLLTDSLDTNEERIKYFHFPTVLAYCFADTNKKYKMGKKWVWNFLCLRCLQKQVSI